MISSFSHFRRSTGAALVLASLSLVAACGDDDPTDPEPEPQIQTMTLTAGASSITIDKTTGAASGQLTIPAGTTTITATFRKADGSVESLVTGTEFDVRIRPVTGTPFTWTPNTTLGGTLVTSGVTSGQTIPAEVDLFHREEQHEDFGEYTFTIRIQ